MSGKNNDKAGNDNDDKNLVKGLSQLLASSNMNKGQDDLLKLVSTDEGLLSVTLELLPSWKNKITKTTDVKIEKISGGASAVSINKISSKVNGVEPQVIVVKVNRLNASGGKATAKSKLVYDSIDAKTTSRVFPKVYYLDPTGSTGPSEISDLTKAIEIQEYIGGGVISSAKLLVDDIKPIATGLEDLGLALASIHSIPISSLEKTGISPWFNPKKEFSDFSAIGLPGFTKELYELAHDKVGDGVSNFFNFLTFVRSKEGLNIDEYVCKGLTDWFFKGITDLKFKTKTFSRLSVIHGDFHNLNLLQGTDDHFVAIDFEGLRIGTPAFDFGTLFFVMPNAERATPRVVREAIISAYIKSLPDGQIKTIASSEAMDDLLYDAELGLFYRIAFLCIFSFLMLPPASASSDGPRKIFDCYDGIFKAFFKVAAKPDDKDCVKTVVENCFRSIASKEFAHSKEVFIKLWQADKFAEVSNNTQK